MYGLILWDEDRPKNMDSPTLPFSERDDPTTSDDHIHRHDRGHQNAPFVSQICLPAFLKFVATCVTKLYMDFFV